MSRVRITLVKSLIRRLPAQVATIHSLGLRKLNQSVEHDNNKVTQGKISVVRHLVRVEEVV